MASSKVMASSKPRNSDLSSSSSRSRRPFASSTSPRPSTTKPPSQSLSHSQLPSDLIIRSNKVHDLTPSTPSPPTMNVDGILHNVYSAHSSSESTLLDAQITVIDNPAALPPQSVETSSNGVNNNNSSSGQDTGSASVFPQSSGKTVEEVWREIVAGRKEMKDEPDEMMTLEDFLAKAGAVDVGGGGGGGREEDEVKMPQPERLSGGVYAFDPVQQSAFQVLDNVEGSIIGFGNEVDVLAGGVGVGGGGRGKRGRAPALEPLDKAAQQRQRRMIKNRESAARSRERKQAYQVELESLAVRLEEENEQLLKEKEERTRERFKQLMERVVPVVEKRKPPRVLRKIHSWRW